MLGILSSIVYTELHEIVHMENVYCSLVLSFTNLQCLLLYYSLRAVNIRTLKRMFLHYILFLSNGLTLISISLLLPIQCYHKKLN